MLPLLAMKMNSEATGQAKLNFGSAVSGYFKLALYYSTFVNLFFLPISKQNKYAVGLGNIWRFPYLCYKNGGGAFLLAYWTLSMAVGFPVVLLEQSIGQYTSQGPMHCWRFAPVLLGAGAGMVALSFFVCTYYSVIISWAVYYLYSSFRWTLPWQQCEYPWADSRCETPVVDDCGFNETIKGTDGLCYISHDRLSGDVSVNSTSGMSVLGIWNETMAQDGGFSPMMASDQFFQ